MPSSSKKSKIVHNQSITIVDISNSGSILNTYIVYNIETIESASSPSPIKVSRRYNEFLWLYERVSLVPGLFLTTFPEKVYLESKSDDVISERAETFSFLLQALNSSDHPFANAELNYFIKTNDEEFKLRVKNTPALMPAFSSIGTPRFESDRFLEFAQQMAAHEDIYVRQKGRKIEAELKNKALKEDQLMGFDEVEEVIGEENDEVDDLFLSDKDSVLHHVGEAAKEVVEKIEMIQENEEGEFLHKDEIMKKVEVVLNLFSSGSKDREKEKENVKLFGQGVESLKKTFEIVKVSFAELAEAVNKSQSEISKIRVMKNDVDRVKKYFFDMKEKFLNADVKLKSNNARINASSNLSEKYKIEKQVAEIEKFMLGIRILLHLYGVNMPRKFKESVDKKNLDITRVCLQLKGDIIQCLQNFLNKFKDSKEKEVSNE